MPTFRNKIFISADFEQKNFGRKSAKNRQKIGLIGRIFFIKRYETNFFYLCNEKIELM